MDEGFKSDDFTEDLVELHKQRLHGSDEYVSNVNIKHPPRFFSINMYKERFK